MRTPFDQRHETECDPDRDIDFHPRMAFDRDPARDTEPITDLDLDTCPLFVFDFDTTISISL